METEYDGHWCAANTIQGPFHFAGCKCDGHFFLFFRYFAINWPYFALKISDCHFFYLSANIQYKRHFFLCQLNIMVILFCCQPALSDCYFWAANKIWLFWFSWKQWSLYSTGSQQISMSIVLFFILPREYKGHIRGRSLDKIGSRASRWLSVTVNQFELV